jgi:hypothetical protein
LAWIDATSQPSPGPEFVLPKQASPPHAAPPTSFGPFGEPPHPPPPKGRFTWKGWTAIAVSVFVVLVLVVAIIGAATSGSSKKTTTASNSGSQPAAAPTLNDLPSDEIPATEPGFPSDEPPGSTPNLAPFASSFGQPVELSQNGDDAGSVTVDAPSLAASFLDGFETPKSGQFVYFDVHFHSQINGFDTNEWDFYVRDTAGNHYDPSSWKDPSFSATTLNTDEKVSGYITFDAPAHGTLVYAPNYGQGSVAEWSY